MNITTSSGIREVPVTSKAVHKATLMKEDYIKISFTDTDDYKFKAGDYVEWENQKYYLPEDYIPTMTNESTFSYDMKFNAPWYNLDKYMFLFNTYSNGEIVKRESDWNITDDAKNIISLIIKSTQDSARSCPCAIGDTFYCENTEKHSFSFSSTSVLAALNSLSKEFELEWWFSLDDGTPTLHFGECDSSIVYSDGETTFLEDGSRKKDTTKQTLLTTGDNVGSPSITQRSGLSRYYYVYGSSRNIDQTVDVQKQGSNYVTSLVTKRLSLDNPIDAYEMFGVSDGTGEEVVIFDDIYPKSDYQITGVSSFRMQSEDIEGYDSNGTPIYKLYTIYNLQIKAFSDYIFTLINDENEDVQNAEDIIASGKKLSLKFLVKLEGTTTNTPKLAGFEFELAAILKTDTDTAERWYEFQIVKQTVNDYVIPNDVLCPEVGDWVCIYNIKGKYIDGNATADSKTELTAQFKKWYLDKRKDITYSVKPYVDTLLDLSVGDAVKLVYHGNEVVSRVYSFEKRLDNTINATYELTRYVTQGTVNQLKDEVKSLNVALASTTNSDSGSTMDLSGGYLKHDGDTSDGTFSLAFLKAYSLESRSYGNLRGYKLTSENNGASPKLEMLDNANGEITFETVQSDKMSVFTSGTYTLEVKAQFTMETATEGATMRFEAGLTDATTNSFSSIEKKSYCMPIQRVTPALVTASDVTDVEESSTDSYGNEVRNWNGNDNIYEIDLLKGSYDYNLTFVVTYTFKAGSSGLGGVIQSYIRGTNYKNSSTFCGSSAVGVRYTPSGEYHKTGNNTGWYRKTGGAFLFDGNDVDFSQSSYTLSSSDLNAMNVLVGMLGSEDTYEPVEAVFKASNYTDGQTDTDAENFSIRSTFTYLDADAKLHFIFVLMGDKYDMYTAEAVSKNNTSYSFTIVKTASDKGNLTVRYEDETLFFDNI